MSHDLRQALGFRRLPASDPIEQEMRDKWYATKAAAEGKPDGSSEATAFWHVNRELSDYLWQRASKEIAADRAKHPKARRNQVFNGPMGQGRSLP